MKKIKLTSMVILCGVMLVISGCHMSDNSHIESRETLESWLVLTHDNAFRGELNTMLFEMGMALQVVASSEDTEKLHYAKGRLDSISERHYVAIYPVFNRDNMNEEISQKIIHPDLVEPLSQMVSRLRTYLNDLRETVIRASFSESEKDEMQRLGEVLQRFQGDSTMYIDEPDSMLRKIDEVDGMLEVLNVAI